MTSGIWTLGRVGLGFLLLFVMWGCGPARQDENPLAHVASRKEAIELLGKPLETTQPMVRLPEGYRAELEKRHLLAKAKSWDKFKEFRVATSLPAAPGICFWYVIYDEKGLVVSSFRRILD